MIVGHWLLRYTLDVFLEGVEVCSREKHLIPLGGHGKELCQGPIIVTDIKWSHLHEWIYPCVCRSGLFLVLVAVVWEKTFYLSFSKRAKGLNIFNCKIEDRYRRGSASQNWFSTCITTNTTVRETSLVVFPNPATIKSFIFYWLFYYHSLLWNTYRHHHWYEYCIWIGNPVAVQSSPHGQSDRVLMPSK